MGQGLDRNSVILGTLLKQSKLCGSVAGIPAFIDDELGRLQFQKAVYLFQALDVQFGYQYSWYKKGPYSPSLTKDYYQLRNSLAWGEELPDKRLIFHKDEIEAKFGALISIPEDYKKDSLEQERRAYWMELLASLHYKIVKERATRGQAKDELSKSKPYLFDPRNSGEIALNRLVEANVNLE